MPANLRSNHEDISRNKLRVAPAPDLLLKAHAGLKLVQAFALAYYDLLSIHGLTFAPAVHICGGDLTLSGLHWAGPATVSAMYQRDRYDTRYWSTTEPHPFRSLRRVAPCEVLVSGRTKHPSSIRAKASLVLNTVRVKSAMQTNTSILKDFSHSYEPLRVRPGGKVFHKSLGAFDQRKHIGCGLR